MPQQNTSSPGQPDDGHLPDRVLMSGNDAIGEGAIRAGCDCYFGYPITPQNELTAFMATQMPAHGRVFVQAESELASINMVFGAAATGKRAMTSSSSPGISLMQEGISFISCAQLPCLVVNVQRGGPGLGNIAPAQGDYFQATRGGGHGDYRNIVLAPASVQEMHDFTIAGFDLADKYRIPVILLADGQLGQMMEPLRLALPRTAAPVPKPWALTGAVGREPNIVRSLYLKDGDLEAVNERLQALYAQILGREERHEEWQTEDCELLLAGYGTSARLARAAAHEARRAGIRAGVFRPITLWPFPYAPLRQISRRCRAALVVEMSYGQMLEDVQLAFADRAPVHFIGRGGGGIPTVSEIVGKIHSIMK